MDYAQIYCENVVHAGQTFSITVAGFSMWPAISPGMKVKIVPLKSTWPEKGSIILFKREDGLTLHRCWGVTCVEGRTMMLTKGDNNVYFDPPVSSETIIGQVSSLKRDYGRYHDPNRGWLHLYGQILCSSFILANIWAKVCRIVLDINRQMYRIRSLLIR